MWLSAMLSASILLSLARHYYHERTSKLKNNHETSRSQKITYTRKIEAGRLAGGIAMRLAVCSIRYIDAV